MSSYLVRDYWPPFLSGEPGKKVFTYPANGATALWRAIFYWDAPSKSMVLVSVDANGKWMNTWHLRWDDLAGLIEYQDDEPLTGWLASIFGKTKVTYLDPPIGWGRNLDVGTPFWNHPQQSILRSSPPSLGLTGFQVIMPEAHHETWNGFNDVLQFIYQQQFGDKIAGARMWMAKGIGPVGNQWAARAVDGSTVYADVQVAEVS